MAEPASLPQPVCPVLAGPTAVGKTALVLQLAERLPIEVISLDSRQIYRGMRIGTAQPTAAERAACAHHLVDFLPPDRTYSAGAYRLDFAHAYRQVRQRGHVPLLVGGAGLYLEAVARGLLHLKPREQAAARRAREELVPLDDEEIRRRLFRLDRESWERIPSGDRYRSQRALEIQQATGRPLSVWRRRRQPEPVMGLRFPMVLLERPTAELDARIAARTRAMLAAGWIEETEALLGQYGPDTPGLRSIGYGQIVDCLLGRLRLEALAADIVLATRQYAKRQRTWFRPHPRLAAGPPDDPAILRTLRWLVGEAGSCA
jgi:tRNA dimethylallyltransferase